MPHGTLEELGDRHYLGRLLGLVTLGAACALLLTWFMHQLIASSQQRLDESTRAHIVDFVRMKREESSATKDRRPTKPTVSQAPPAPAAPDDASQSESTLTVSDTQLPDGFGPDLMISGLGIASSDGEYLPIVKVAPIYPKRAAMKNLEGSCVVVYTVTANGSTRDVKVVEHMCTDPVFYRPSIQAARKFKYKPRVIDGEAIEVRGVSNRFVYEFAD